MTRASPSVSRSYRYECEKNSSFHSARRRSPRPRASARRARRERPKPSSSEIRASQTLKNARENVVAVIESYARRPSVAPVVPASSPRRHRSSSSSSVVLPHPPSRRSRCVLVASSVVAPTSFTGVASRRVHARGRRRVARVWSFPHVRACVAFSVCPNVYFIDDRRATSQVG